MPELSKKLERFTSILLAEATEETQRTLDALKQKHDAALSAAEDQVLQEAYDYIHAEVSRIRSEQGQKVSQRLMENKRALSRRREEIAQEVFVAVDEGEVTDIAQGVFGGVLVRHGKTLGLEMGQLIFVCTERLCQNPPRMQKRRTRGPSSRSRASQVSGT